MVESSWTLADLAALEQAMKGGLRSATLRDKSVSFQSLAEMLQLRNVMRAELGASGAPAVIFAGRIE